MAFDIEQFPTSDSGKRLLGMVTGGFYDRSYVGKWLFEVLGIELDRIHGIVDSLLEQAFIETATWGLMYHEQKWGLDVNPNGNVEARRLELIKKRDLRISMTPYKMEQYIYRITGHRVRIADIHDPYPDEWVPDHPCIFRVSFIDSETHGEIDRETLYAALDAVKQSHTSYTVEEYYYNKALESHIIVSHKQRHLCTIKMEGV